MNELTPGPAGGDRTPLRLLVITAISILLAEILIMFLLAVFHPLTQRMEALLDGIVLTVLIVPILYFSLFRPMTLLIAERRRAEEALQQAHHELERRVEERTGQLANANAALQAQIAERKRAEARLAESEALAQSLVETLPQNVFRKDLSGRFTFANQRFCQSLGRPKADILGKTDFDFFPPALAEKYQNDDRRVIAAGKLFETVEEHQPPDGQKLFVQVTKTPLYDTHGQAIGVQGIFWDVTERMRAEEQIRAQARLLDLAQDAIVVRDLEGRLQYANQAAERLSGWKAAEAFGRKATDLVHQDAAAFEAAQKQLLETGAWSGELRLVAKDGKEFIVFSRWTLLRDEAGQPKSVLAISTDIGEQKKLEAQFLRVQRLEGIGTLAGGIAHDLNNILSPILMSAAMLRLEQSEAEIEQTLTILERSARRGAEIVRQLLTFGRGVEGERVAVQLKHLIKDMVKMVRETFPKTITVSAKAPDGLWPVLGDATQLHQVLLNLCVNARDAMPAGGHLSLTAQNAPLEAADAGTPPEAKAGPYVRLQVTDNGQGIAPEIIEKIFDPFFTTKAFGKGSGLGLSTVLGIVQSHGGFLHVRSEVGQGSTFEVYLPATPEAEALAAATAPVELKRGQGELILLVDDEARIRELSQMLLEEYGYRVVGAADGIEALTLFAQQRHSINLVLTDLLMPLLDGLSLVRGLKKMDPQVKVIVASGIGSSSTLQTKLSELEALGVTTILAKPVSVDKLLNALHDMLRGSE
ncbi:MAG: PAS domain-containing protein [Verrucomicrobia bacterium]|nr:PAS domain-containing protein [Verrucomicrobiota bacterium]